MRVVSVLAQACCLYTVRGGSTTGLSIVGDASAPPQLIFAATDDMAVAPSLSRYDDPTDTLPAKLEIQFGGSTRASFAGDVANFPHVVMHGDLSAKTLSYGGTPQWRLYDLDTFDVTDSGDWSLGTKGFCGVPEDQFLGGHCKFGATTTIRRYANLPPHTKMRIKARVHFFDDWEGESVIMNVDNSLVWAHSHDWCPGFLKDKCIQLGMDSCGRQTPDKLSVKAEVSMAHTAETMDLAFTSSMPLGTDACMKSWGLDDVSIELI